jgi:moderate conductance mechanosensitive channel
LILEPLKMQRVDNLGDYAVQIRTKMMTPPGEKFVIHRQADAISRRGRRRWGVAESGMI